jgi:mRNA interferase RelE/StbE
MAWRVEFDAQADKELDRLDPQYAKRILKYLFERIATDKDPRRFGAPLRHDLIGLWKYRVGDYRLVCEIKDAVLVVLVARIGHRREIYIKR